MSVASAKRCDTSGILSDRWLLTVLFAAVFCFYVGPSLRDTIANLFFFDHTLDTTRTVGAAEILGFFALAVILGDIGEARLLRWWDYVALVVIAAASLALPHAYGTIFTGLGLFICPAPRHAAFVGWATLYRSCLDRILGADFTQID